MDAQAVRPHSEKYPPSKLSDIISMTPMDRPNIMTYEPLVWSCADLLRGAGIKQSDYPAHMMPFFALMMLESRMLRYKEQLAEEGLTDERDIEEEFRDSAFGYNPVIVKEGITVRDLVKSEAAFLRDWQKYLAAFDPDIRKLLGVNRGSSEEKFLDISGISAVLQKKGILYQTVALWSNVDLRDYNNSEITTLEEHIKRKWADLSATTAGEQYTPDDIIRLIGEIICSKIPRKPAGTGFTTLYDPTCGGGNLLFGVADAISERVTAGGTVLTRGVDWNDALYALASIESRFREQSEIAHANTLVENPYSGTEFDAVVANPPYGVSWKGYQKDIERLAAAWYPFRPSVSDGQLLFTQHIVSRLNAAGIAVVVHNGSTLFSGGAGSGESNIRKLFFDNDWVEALIQLPGDEFFNTGITTYLWVFNKAKSPERRNKVILIDASRDFVSLKKNKGQKRVEMDDDGRAKIVSQLARFEETETAKVFSKYDFYYNYQALLLAPLDDEGRPIPKGKKVKDYEVIPYSPDEAENEAGIRRFLDDNLHGRPYTLGENKVGVEINFNKVFYRPAELPSVDALLAEITALDTELATLHQGLGIRN